MAEPKTNELMEKIVSVCKRRGFVYQSSEIYGGINGFWDYGPLGAELKRNVKDAWWRTMVHHRDDVSGLEATIIMHPQIWRASGHVDTFSDPMCDCLLTKKRFRADQVEPQSGNAYHFVGAIGNADLFAAMSEAGFPAEQIEVKDEGLPSAHLLLKDSFEREAFASILEKFRRASKLSICSDAFSALANVGKPIESALKVGRQFYEQRGVTSPLLILAKKEKIENSQRFNPENGAQLTAPVPFNLMFKTYVGPTATEEDVAYLRPETAQAIFAQFKNVLETSRQKVPFGIAQVGKAFRNEVTPRNFTFRSREFEQMELEFFIKPDEAVEAVAGSVAQVNEDGWKGEPQPNWGWEVWHKYWVEQRIRFYEAIGLPRQDFVEYWQKPEELAHYAQACVDILYKFPFGTQELEGIAARSDFDLTQHEKHSGKSLGVFDEELRAAWGKLDEGKKAQMKANFIQRKIKALVERKHLSEAEAKVEAETEASVFFEKLPKGQYIPHVIEPSAGVDRLILALLCHAYTEVTTTDDKGKSETRVVMKFHPRIAPIKVGIFPLLKNKPELVKKAMEVRDLLRPHMTVFYDDGGAIGRRYARQDEAGTPFGITIDFETLGEKPELLDTVTLRERDTMKQERVPISELLPRLLERIR